MNYLQIKRKLEQTNSEKLTQLVRYYGINEPNDNDRLWKLAMYITTQKKPKEHPKGTRSYIYQENVSGAKEYYTHNSGRHPFLVRVNEDGIYIFTHNPDNSTGYRELLRDDEVNPRSQYPELVDTITDYQGYWWGFDPNDPTLHGNSILVDIDDHNYLYIGDTIYRFKTKDVIRDYVSTVDDIPYPVGFGDDNVYLMLDQVYVPRDKINTSLDVDNAINVYREFYGHLSPGFTKKDVKKIQVEKQQ